LARDGACNAFAKRRRRLRTSACTSVFVLLVPIVAWAQKIDVSNDSITCNTGVSSVSITPALVIGGMAPAAVMRVKGVIAGCTVTGLSPVSIVSGKLSGKVEAPSNECISLSQPLTGTITIRWKPDKMTPIVPTSSTFDVTDVTFGGFSAPWGVSYGQFSLGMGPVTGAFTGGDGGATSSNVPITGEDILEIVRQCGSRKGLETLHVGLGQLRLL